MTEKNYGKDWNCLNLSSIWTKLIKESAECEHYSSDFLIQYDCIVRKLNTGCNKLTEYFGFRDYGVDHDTFIKCRLSEYKPYEYRKIYKLTIEHCDYLNYEGYCDWKAELSDISEESVENILKMIEEDE